MHCHNIIRYYSRAWTFLSFFIFLSFSFRFLMNAALTQWTLSVYDSISCCKLKKTWHFFLWVCFVYFICAATSWMRNSYWIPIDLYVFQLNCRKKNWKEHSNGILLIFDCSATTILIFFTLRNNDSSVSSHLKIISTSLLSIQSFRCSMGHTAKDHPSNFSQ